MPEKVGSQPDTRQLADKHKDVEFGNAYRLEYIKHLMAIAAGVFALTVTFSKDLLGQAITTAQWKPALLLGWACLLVSLLAGVLHMRYWASYFTSWAVEHHSASGRRWRGRVNRYRLITELIQIMAFFVGLGSIFVFAAVNIYP